MAKPQSSIRQEGVLCGFMLPADSMYSNSRLYVHFEKANQQSEQLEEGCLEIAVSLCWIQAALPCPAPYKVVLVSVRHT